MADIPNIPGGAVPPKKETGKVQPKKETVRINLPPKPSAAPTIKLPTLPPGGPGGGPGGAVPPPSATAAPAAPALAKTGAAAPMAAPKPAPTSAPKAPAPMRSAPAISGLDKFLAIAAAVAGLVAAGSVGYLYYLFQNAS